YHEHIHLEPDELGYEVGEPFGLFLCPAVLDDDGASLAIAEFTQSLPEGIEEGAARIGGGPIDEPDTGDCHWRLCMGGERYQEKAKDQGEERHQGLHRSTSLAWKRSVGGIVRPSACAVFRLITSSNFIGCSTG